MQDLRLQLTVHFKTPSTKELLNEIDRLCSETVEGQEFFCNEACEQKTEIQLVLDGRFSSFFNDKEFANEIHGLSDEITGVVVLDIEDVANEGVGVAYSDKTEKELTLKTLNQYCDNVLKVLNDSVIRFTTTP